jgi:hypothetical protein
MAVDWERYQKCSEVCGAAMGKPCLKMSGFVVEGAVTIAVEAEEPHSSRKLRAGR